MSLNILIMVKIIKIPTSFNNINWENRLLTEYMSFKYIENNYSDLPCTYIAFPWAFLIDSFNCKFKNKYNMFFDYIKDIGLLDLLSESENYITTVQSYHLFDYLQDFNKMKIKYIFCPHANKNKYVEIYQKFNIIVIPYYIYPSNSNYTNYKRIYNTSFICTTTCPLERPTRIRNKIVNFLQKKKNVYVKTLDNWHFNDTVFGDQLKVLKYDKMYLQHMNEREEEYSKIMSKSIFSICPLGIGPNSIRLWESFMYRSIPILIADDLWLPEYFNVNWDKLIYKVKEDNIENIDNILNMDAYKIKSIKKRIKKFSKKFLTDNNFGKLIPLFFKKYNPFNLLISWYNMDETSERYKEIYTCLENNLNNKLIKKIYLFYEVDDITKIKNIYHKKIKIIPIVTNKKRDISFNLLADFANKHLFNQLCIISNNDIYFDDTLQRIYELDFYNNNYFISLTRKNCRNYLSFNNKIWKPHKFSQDTWIFQTPIKKMEHVINLGWIQCDNIITNQYIKLNYNVINPYYSINAWHLHENNNTLSLINNYNYNYKYNISPIDFTDINNICKKRKTEVKKYFNFNINKLKNMKTKL